MVQLCRIQPLQVASVDSRGVWLQSGDESIHLPLREAPDAAPGDSLEVFVYLDPTGRLQATLREPLAQAGEFASLTVRSVSPHGAFLDWGLPKDLLAPYALQPERMQPGRSYLVRVCVDERGRPYADARIEEALEHDLAGLSEGDGVTLTVWQLTDLGAKVVVNDRFPGLLYRDELPPGVVPGVRLKGYVKRVRDDGKLDVTTRKVGAEGAAEARDALLASLRAHGGFLPLSDSSSPEEIRSALDMSKKSFKKALG
ncbi:MAG TPA: S1-like domain-containing RNA-binding protein, partial [Verrucomicrobiae bacterium]|nr:S1-like domain-containing RNA-binding protein [Verrucomicrobiae bacterium]